MSAPRLLIDSDILILLICSGLVDQTLDTLGFNRSSVFHLDTLRYRLRTDKSLVILPDSWKTAITRECSRLQVLSEQPDAEMLKILRSVRKIDDGEDILYAHLAINPSYLLTSGDKKAMRALATDARAQAIRDAVAGRIICLETVCDELVTSIGVHQVAQAFAPLFAKNVSLRTYFGAVEVSGEEGCRTAIGTYFRQLENDLGQGFLWSR